MVNIATSVISANTLVHKKGALTKHRKGHFLTLQECPICQKKVKQLKRHAMRCMSKNKAKRYPCNQCDKTFAFAHGLKTHVNQINRQIKDFHCDICDYKTYTITNLRIHTSSIWFFPHRFHTDIDDLACLMFKEIGFSKITSFITVIHYFVVLSFIFFLKA